MKWTVRRGGNVFKLMYVCSQAELIEEDAEQDRSDIHSSHQMNAKFDKAYEKMQVREKWTLTTGKYVEDQLYHLGQRCKHEQ